MKKQFRLESLLNYRKSIEEKIQIELASLREKEFKEKENLSRIKDMQRSMLKRFYEKNKMDDIGYLELLSNEYIYRKKVLADLAEKITQTQKELISATKARKVLEKLKDRKIREFNNYLVQQENKFMDGVAIARYVTGDE